MRTAINGVQDIEDACSRALSTGEIDLVHIDGDSIRVVAAFEKVRDVDTYRLIRFRSFCRLY
jgi:hypothetical protein